MWRIWHIHVFEEDAAAQIEAIYHEPSRALFPTTTPQPTAVAHSPACNLGGADRFRNGTSRGRHDRQSPTTGA